MDFKELKPSDYDTLKPFFEDQKYPICVYSLSSTIAWSGKEYKPYYTIYDKSLILSVEYATKKDYRHLILPITPYKEYEPEQLKDILKDLGHKSYWFVPDVYIAKYGKEKIENFFEILEQEGYHDYVYLAEDLASLKGNKYSKKRNLINQFRKEYLEKQTVTIDNIKSKDIDDCLNFLEEWCIEAHCDHDENYDLACEKQATKNTLKNIEIFDEATGLLLRIDGKVNAFGIASKLTKDMGVLHFEKAFSSIKGLYQFFDQECAKRLFNGYKYINKESDMGVQGLIQAKKSYNPALIIKSYQFKLKN
ncbi:MAG: DUF2156 domain-containing protein [Desulfobacterales bacterium]|nr:DUF2156 domain-containing protein [Desulfobacterales bacterium]